MTSFLHNRFIQALPVKDKNVPLSQSPFFTSQILIMARILTTAFMADIRGNVSGSTFKQTGSGLGVQAKHVGKKTGMAAGRSSKGLTAYVAGLWRTLSDADRLEWSAVASLRNTRPVFGQSKPLTGFQYFMLTNKYKFQQFGITELSSPWPYDPPHGRIEFPQYDSFANYFSIVTYFKSAYNAGYILSFATNGQPAHLAYRRGAYRLFGNGATSLYSTGDAQDTLIQGTVNQPVCSPGQRIFCRFVCQDLFSYASSVFEFNCIAS